MRDADTIRLEDQEYPSATGGPGCGTSLSSRTIYGGLSAGFGDALIYLAVAKHHYDCSGERVRLSRWTLDPPRDRRALYLAILEAFNLGEVCEVVDESASRSLDDLNPSIWPELEGPIRPLRSLPRATTEPTRQIAFQFDGSFQGDLKSPTSDQVVTILEAFPEHRMLRLGRHYSIRRNLELLHESECFLGIDSGIAQLAYTTGVPMFLMRNGHFFEPNHAPNWGRRAEVVSGPSELIASASAFVRRVSNL